MQKTAGRDDVLHSYAFHTCMCLCWTCTTQPSLSKTLLLHQSGFNVWESFHPISAHLAWHSESVSIAISKTDRPQSRPSRTSHLKNRFSLQSFCLLSKIWFFSFVQGLWSTEALAVLTNNLKYVYPSNDYCSNVTKETKETQFEHQILFCV